MNKPTRKFALMPLVPLGQKTNGQFLEIMSEPAWFWSVNMEALSYSGFSKNVLQAKELLRHIPKRPSSAHLYATGLSGNISNQQDINLGLVLASFLQEPACPYQKILLTGRLDMTKPDLPVTTAVNFEVKLKTILKLGKQTQALPFFFPEALYIEEYKPLLSELEAINIRLLPISSLWQGLRYFGITH